MAQANQQLINALTETAARLDNPTTKYQWTHQGACNCGHLAQTVTKLSRVEIHEMALQRAGDWSEHAIDYCPKSNYPVDHIITTLLELGLNTNDLVHLERLNRREILRDIPKDRLPLKKNRREDVVLYLRTWAQQLARELPEPIQPQAIIETRLTATIDGKTAQVFSSRAPIQQPVKAEKL